MKTQDRRNCTEIFNQNICVLAGAGSGKTTLLVERFLNAMTNQKIPAQNILAITFTDKAANEMKLRLVSECLKRGWERQRRDLESAYVGTIHSFCARMLRENPIESGVDPAFRILSEGESDVLADQVLDRMFEIELDHAEGLDLLLKFGEEAVRSALKNIYETTRAVTDAKGRLLTLETQEKEKREFFRLFDQFAQEYDKEKRSQGAYDFQDLLYLTYRLFSGGSLQSQAVLRRTRDRFKAILVDEVQDTSLLQFHLLDLLRSRNNLFVVGDSQQSIYGFRHAEPALLEEFISKIPETKKVVLSENFRSRPEIIRFVNHFFKRIAPSRFRALEAGKEYPGRQDAAIVCLSIDPRENENLPEARLREAKSLAALVRSLLRDEGLEPKDVAILFRTATNAYLYEKELSDLEISTVFSRSSGFYDKNEVRDLVNFLRILDDPGQDIPLAGVLRSPLVDLSDDALFWLSHYAKRNNRRTPLAAGVQALDSITEISSEDRAKLKVFWEGFRQLRDEQARLRVTDIFQKIIDRTRVLERVLAQAGGSQALANVLKLMQMIDALESKGLRDVHDLALFFNAMSDRDVMEPDAKLSSENINGVTLSTIHAAKGLEFPCVILADLGSGTQGNDRSPFLLHPEIGFGVKPDEIYERIQAASAERDALESERLMYVAMTRAKDRLIFSGVRRESSWMARVAEIVGFSDEKKTFDVEGVRVDVR